MKRPVLVLIFLSLVIPCYAVTPQVTLETNFGDIVIELYEEDAPITVANFLAYVNSGFYDGLMFHRVIDEFMIQSGIFDPNMVKKPPADPIINESYNGLLNVRGTIAMARTGEPNSATSQFFINQDPDPSERGYLNYGDPNSDGFGYCVFGEVISDMNIVDAIAVIDTNGSDVPIGPNSPVMIYSARSTDGILGDVDESFSVDYNDLTNLSVQWVEGTEKNISSDNMNGSTEVSGFSGDVYVWEDGRGSDADIYGYSLTDSNEFEVLVLSGDQEEPSIDGDIVVYRDDRAGGERIYGYNLLNESEFLIRDSGMLINQPDVSGNIAVWRDYRNYHTDNGEGKLKTDIYGADISDVNNVVDFAICTEADGQLYPAIDGDIVVWDDYRDGVHDIYGADITDINEPNVFSISTAAGKQTNPDVSGDIVIWEDYRYSTIAIFGYDLTAEEEFSIAFGEVANSDIDGDIVVWQDKRNGDWDIYGYDLSEDIEFIIVTGDGDQVNPLISGNKVVWRDLRNSPNDLYWRELCDVHVRSDVNGDCIVNFVDYGIMTSNWLEDNLF